MALEDDLDTLYASPLDEFVDRRKGIAQTLRKAGRKDDAAKVVSAAKPTPAAWAVNQIARRSPQEMAELMAVGVRLRALLRSAFSGQGDASAMSEVQSAQRAVVTRLTEQAARILGEAGASSSPATLERITATLTTISTTGAWGGSPAAQLARDLDPPSLDVLAALVEDVASAAPRAERTEKSAPQNDAPPAPANRDRESRAQKEERARREAAEARERIEQEARKRIEQAEAALQAASALEEQRRAELDRARATVEAATSRREEREAQAREARHLAIELEEAAREAQRKADAAALAARRADDEAATATREETAAKADLTTAEKTLAHATAESVAAEEALVRARRDQIRLTS